MNLTHRILGSRQYIPGADKPAQITHLEVQMGTCRVAGTACGADVSSLVYILPAVYADGAQVGIQRLLAGAMIDHDHVSISLRRPTGEDNHPAVSGINSIADAGSNVDPQMT